MKTPTKTRTQNNTKEAYQMIINDYAFYGVYTYGGWAILSAIANALQVSSVKIERVFVEEKRVLLGE